MKHLFLIAGLAFQTLILSDGQKLILVCPDDIVDAACLDEAVINQACYNPVTKRLEPCF
jgi:hypothetical protein